MELTRRGAHPAWSQRKPPGATTRHIREFRDAALSPDAPILLHAASSHAAELADVDAKDVRFIARLYQRGGGGGGGGKGSFADAVSEMFRVV